MKRVAAIAMLALLVASCSTDKDESDEATAPEETTTVAATDDTTADTTTTVPSGDTGETTTTVEAAPEIEPIVDDRAPGVSDTTITIAVAHVSRRSDGRVTHGDYELAFNAVADAINARGRMHGRQLVLEFAPEDTEADDGVTASCVRATQDIGAFAVVGELRTNAPCYIVDNSTALVGGEISAAVLADADAPWFSPGNSEDGPAAGVEAMIEAGLLDGTVAVLGTLDDEPLYENKILPVLEAAGIEATVVLIDTTSGDEAATNAVTDTTLERFESDGVDQILMIGSSVGVFVPPRIGETDYRPALRYTNLGSANFYIANGGTDFSILEGAAAADSFDGRNHYESLGGLTDECIQILTDAGINIRPENDVPEGEEDEVVSGSIACRHLYLLEAILEAAGPELNYGTFATAGYSLGEIELPFMRGPQTFGPPPSSDGNPESVTYLFDAATSTFVES